MDFSKQSQLNQARNEDRRESIQMQTRLAKQTLCADASLTVRWVITVFFATVDLDSQSSLPVPHKDTSTHELLRENSNSILALFRIEPCEKQISRMYGTL